MMSRRRGISTGKIARQFHRVRRGEINANRGFLNLLISSLAPHETRLYDLVRENPQGITTREIANETGLSINAIGTILLHLTKEYGLLRRERVDGNGYMYYARDLLLERAE